MSEKGKDKKWKTCSDYLMCLLLQLAHLLDNYEMCTKCLYFRCNKKMHFFFESLTSVANKTAVCNLITEVAGSSGTEVWLSEYMT